MTTHGALRGIEVSGIPIGEDNKADAAMSKISKIYNAIPDRHPQSLYAVTYYCHQQKFRYWIQHCYPDQVAGAAARVDEALLAIARACIGCDITNDALALRRLHLPARMYGGGIRALVDTAPAAFARRSHLSYGAGFHRSHI